MTYRDEREALRAQVQDLEERLEAAEERLAEARRRDAPPNVRRRIRRVALTATGVALVAGAGGVAVFSNAVRDGSSTRTPPPPAPPPTRPIATPAPPPPPSPPPIRPPPSAIVATPAPDAGAEQTRGDTARWHATVQRAEGIELARDAACTLEVNVRAMAYRRYRYTPGDLMTIACGGRALYRWSDPVQAGIEQRDCDVAEERVGDTSVWRYRLRCHDHGTRSGGRPELEFDTNTRQVSIRQSGASPWRVELAVDALSVPRFGEELQRFDTQRAGPPFDGPVTRTGRVTAVTGAVPGGARVGARCGVLVVHQPWSSNNCRVTVLCGSAVLYGAGTSGWTSCTVEGNAPIAARDASGSRQDSDPAMTMDLRAGRIELVDEPAPGRAWSLALELDAPDAGRPTAR